jgi:hypothetical protein
LQTDKDVLDFDLANALQEHVISTDLEQVPRYSLGRRWIATLIKACLNDGHSFVEVVKATQIGLRTKVLGDSGI